MTTMRQPITELGALLSGLYIAPRSLKMFAVLKFREGKYELWEDHDSGRGQSSGHQWISVVDETVAMKAQKLEYLHLVTEEEEPFKSTDTPWYALTKDITKLAEAISLLEAWEEKEYR